jgi:hypothetical protein
MSFINHKYLGQTFIEAGLAQSVERRTLNPVVVGSSPTVGASFLCLLYSSRFRLQLVQLSTAGQISFISPGTSATRENLIMES